MCGCPRRPHGIISPGVQVAGCKLLDMQWESNSGLLIERCTLSTQTFFPAPHSPLFSRGSQPMILSISKVGLSSSNQWSYFSQTCLEICFHCDSRFSHTDKIADKHHQHQLEKGKSFFIKVSYAKGTFKSLY